MGRRPPRHASNQPAPSAAPTLAEQAPRRRVRPALSAERAGRSRAAHPGLGRRVGRGGGGAVGEDGRVGEAGRAEDMASVTGEQELLRRQRIWDGG